MTSVIGILCLLSVLPAAGYALSCTQCMSTSSTCRGISVTCPSGQVCGSAYTESIVGGIKTESLVRTCSPLSECDIEGSMSIQQGQVRIATSCCNSDTCTPTLPALPIKNSTTNGLVCRSCISADSTWCYTSDTVQCTGHENMCLLQTTKITGSVSLSTAIRGCATHSICDFGSQSQNTEGSSTEVKFICTGGSISVYKVVLTPAIVCLLLLKFLF